MRSFSCLGVVLSFAMSLAAAGADADRGVPSPIRSDGSLLNEDFNGTGAPAGWTVAATAGNRADVTFKDGRCTFNMGEGDNFIGMPPLKADLSQAFVIEMALGVPAPVSGSFSILSMSREGGEFQVLIVPADGGAMNVVMTGSKPLGVMEPGKTYTVAVQCLPDGTYKGTLAGTGIAKPVVQSVAGVDGAIHNTVLGNVYGAGKGSLFVDSVKVGRLAK